MSTKTLIDKIKNHKYFPNQEWRMNLKKAVLIFFGVLVLVGFYLRVFTKHNTTLAVPDFKGLTVVQAEKIIDDNNLRSIIIDSVYTNTFAPGAIVDQDPKPGVQVKTDRRIFFYVNALNPEMVKAPNIVGVSLRQAQAIIESNMLVVGNIRYVPDIATNSVLQQRFNGKELKPGKPIPKSSKIDLVLGKAADSEYTKVPALVGEKISSAKKIITESYLNLGSVIYDGSFKTKYDTVNASVWKQKPATAGTPVSMGAFVDIWVTVDPSKVIVKIKGNGK